jgi:hypothetical protein
MIKQGLTGILENKIKIIYSPGKSGGRRDVEIQIDHIETRR